MLDALAGGRSISRAEIARHTGLSRSTVSTVVAELLASGLVHEGAADRPGLGGTGRPGVTVSLNPAAGVAVGIDISHAGVRAIVSDLGNRVLAERTLPHETTGRGWRELVDDAARLTRDAMHEAQVNGTQVGAVLSVPAPVDPTTGLLGSESVIPALSSTYLDGSDGITLARAMEDALGFPVAVENDANLCAMAEHRWGAHPGHDCMLYVKVSRGIGAGVIIDGRLHRGRHGGGGEIGHTSLSPDGPACRCGNRGCLEMTAGADAIVQAVAVADDAPQTIDEVVARALADDPLCRRAIRDVGGMLGQALGSLINLLNPSLVMIGGDIADAWPVLETPIGEALDRCAVHRSLENCVIAPSSLGARSEALGAVELAQRTAGELAEAAA